MRIIFVHQGRENLGVEYISALLKRDGHQVALAYDPGLFGPSDNVFYIPSLEKKFSEKEKVVKKIIDFGPDLVGFSVYTATYQWCCDIAEVIKRKIDTKIVFGGIHSTLVPERVIKRDFVDFVVIGEGEYALLELAEDIDSSQIRSNIKNIWFKQNGRIIRNEIRPAVDIDILPIPDKEMFEDHANYRDDYLIMTDRGCIFNCSYCCESYINKIYCKEFFRRRRVDSVIKELKVMKQRYNYKEVHFNSPVFFTHKMWLKAFLPRFKDEIGVSFKCFGHVSLLDEEIAELLKWAGCYNIQFGVESMNKNTRKEILNRFETDQHIRRAFEICDRYKLRYDIDHMFGLPGEKEKDWIKGAEFYSHCKYLNRIKCHNLTYFPGLSIINIAQKNNVLNRTDIETIEEGKRKDGFFYLFPNEDLSVRKLKLNFEIFYKVLPLLRQSWIRVILHHKLYRKFHLIPPIAIIFLQVLVALRGRDYRFLFYIKNYPIKIAKALIGSIKYKMSKGWQRLYALLLLL